MRQLCLLFDSDGTLVDSEGLCNQAIALLFARYNIELSVSELLRNYRGVALTQIFATLAAQHNITLSDDSESWYRAKVAELFNKKLKPVAGIPQIMAWVKQQGWPCAVVSNGPPAKLQHALQHCELLPYFNGHIYSAYDINFFKPDPRLYLHAATQLGAEPANCVVIEDSLTGVQAGLAAGMTTLFYNVHAAPCPPAAIEIHDMLQLRDILLQRQSAT